MADENKKELSLLERIEQTYTNAAKKGYLGDRAIVTATTKRDKEKKKGHI